MSVTRWEDQQKSRQEEHDRLDAIYEARESAEYSALEARIAAEEAAGLFIYTTAPAAEPELAREWTPIDEFTAGPIVSYCDDSPVNTVRKVA